MTNFLFVVILNLQQVYLRKILNKLCCKNFQILIQVILVQMDDSSGISNFAVCKVITLECSANAGDILQGFTAPSDPNASSKMFTWEDTINPLPLLFKSLLPGREDCVFSVGI
jgi:hypothetical protein